MIKVEHLGYEYPQKELYKDITFTIEDNQHAVLIGSNGTGKSTLISILINPEDYLYDGKLQISEGTRMGYVSQFYEMDEENTMTVFDYLSMDFVKVQNEMNEICTKMESAEDMEAVFEQYQQILDHFDAIGGNDYESNIRKQLKTANLQQCENLSINKLSGGEFKLVQILKEMIVQPNLLIMDEPDVFLDFDNLDGLKNLINTFRGTMLVITHNRFLLSSCFNKILHLENKELQEFEGNYVSYNLALLQTKIELSELAAKD
ncbi:MAG: ATP-binding cassette domain-containing protein, partial [Lachnospira sp.]|nr:ATP-binding cassette domain-containing protein [Lachnospira sp.]